jgi:DNA-3-methyladenine glycosylase I
MFQRQPWMQRAGEHPPSDQDYFLLLARSVFSAGLGPKVIESRWAGLSEAFSGFDPETVAGMGQEQVERLLADPAVIRNRRKIEAVIKNATIFNQCVAEHGSFPEFLNSCGVRESLEQAAEQLAGTFAHLGKTSAAFFLFSCGWRAGQAERESVAASV